MGPYIIEVLGVCFLGFRGIGFLAGVVKGSFGLGASGFGVHVYGALVLELSDLVHLYPKLNSKTTR